MKERPINERGPMVRAILEGRKTQTRRIIKQPKQLAHLFWPDEWIPSLNPIPCPYGKPGDRLWVRETYADDPWEPGDSRVLYRADNPPASAFDPDRGDRWRHSIYMPRWASRITLDITGTRMERLRQISQADAREEGVTDYRGRWWDGSPVVSGRWDGPDIAYAALWKQIHGTGSWDANPWVWVIEFRRLTTTPSKS